MPQGLLKKIELKLLLPDLALQVADLLLGSRKIVRMADEGWPERLHRPTRSPDPFRAVPAILLTPIRQVPLRYLEVCADRFGHFPGQHPLYRRKLELPGENTSFTCGHPGSSLLFSIVSVSHFWGALQKAARE